MKDFKSKLYGSRKETEKIMEGRGLYTSDKVRSVDDTIDFLIRHSICTNYQGVKINGETQRS